MKSINIIIILIQLFFTLGCIQEKQWEKITENTIIDEHDLDSTILGVKFIDQYHGWAITYKNLIETFDGGKNWNQLDLNANSSYTLTSFDYNDVSHFWVTGLRYDEVSGLECGFIMTTRDAGKNWQTINISEVYMIIQARICSPSIIWGVGLKKVKDSDMIPIIIQTANGGNTWNEMYESLNPLFNLTGIACIGPNNIIAIGNNGFIISTIDAGLSWDKRESGVNSILLRIRIFDNIIWIVGDNGTLLKSQDYGQTWISISTDTQKGLLDILIHNEIGWIVGEDGIILSTQNYGKSWEKDISNTFSTLNVLSITEKSVWAVGDNRTVLQLPLD